MRPHTTLRRLLVHPKDKVELEEQGELVYQIPCKKCGAEYIGETGRLLKTTKNTTGGTQKGCRQHEKREIHKEREIKIDVYHQ